MAASTLSLKLLIDTKSHTVLFAEAGKDFVDFLFTILSMPVGTVIRLLTKNLTVGCLQNIYQSIEHLDETYMQPEKNKDSVLKPPIGPTWDPLLLLSDVPTRKYYRCINHFTIVTDDPNIQCPICASKMNVETSFVSRGAGNASSSSGGGGYVKGVVTYMVLDDLSVMPMSSISCINLLNRFHVKQVRDLEERVVNVDMAEGLKLLKASLESRTALTSVFLEQTAA